MKLINPKNGEEFTSRFPNHVAAHAALLARLVAGEFDGSRFAQDIADATTVKGGACAGSKGQLYWLHKLAHEGPTRREPPKAIAKADLTPIKAMLNTAKASGLKWPAITLTTDGGLEFKLTLAGEASRNPGAVYIQSGGRGGRYYGKVTPEGSLFAGKDYVPDVGVLLTQLAADPLGFAAAHGKSHGYCCFCHHKLTREDSSVQLGYGPTCAKRFGLAHGKAAAKRKRSKVESGLQGHAEKDLFGEEVKPKPKVRRLTRRRIEEA